MLSRIELLDAAEEILEQRWQFVSIVGVLLPTGPAIFRMAVFRFSFQGARNFWIGLELAPFVRGSFATGRGGIEISGRRVKTLDPHRRTSRPREAAERLVGSQVRPEQSAAQLGAWRSAALCGRSHELASQLPLGRARAPARPGLAWAPVQPPVPQRAPQRGPSEPPVGGSDALAVDGGPGVHPSPTPRPIRTGRSLVPMAIAGRRALCVHDSRRLRAGFCSRSARAHGTQRGGRCRSWRASSALRANASCMRCTGSLASLERDFRRPEVVTQNLLADRSRRGAYACIRWPTTHRPANAGLTLDERPARGRDASVVRGASDLELRAALQESRRFGGTNLAAVSGGPYWSDRCSSSEHWSCPGLQPGTCKAQRARRLANGPSGAVLSPG